MQTQFPKFNRPVSSNGYCWWYIDAESDDEQHRLTIIAFIGSVFSPYYKRARKKKLVDPLQHCSLNVVLYGKKENRWCMTERHGDDVQIHSDYLSIGPSSLSYTSIDKHTGQLTINIDEKSVPIPRRVKGRIVVDVHLQCKEQFSLDAEGCHIWWPASPNSKINVQLDQPSVQWQGNAYIDMNQGSRPIENDLRYWCWSRFRHMNGTYIHYDVFNAESSLREPPDNAIAIHVPVDGAVRHTKPSTLYSLDRTRWRMRRHARSDTSAPTIISALEDTPFYTRSAIRSCVDLTWLTGINESVSLTRFKKPIVQAMLRFRMPRLRWRRLNC